VDKHIDILTQLLVYYYKSKQLSNLAQHIENKTSTGESFIKVHIIEKLW
jgi:hypothetical protein